MSKTYIPIGTYDEVSFVSTTNKDSEDTLAPSNNHQCSHGTTVYLKFTIWLHRFNINLSNSHFGYAVMHIILLFYLSIYTPKEVVQSLNQQQMYQIEISYSPRHSGGYIYILHLNFFILIMFLTLQLSQTSKTSVK